MVSLFGEEPDEADHAQQKQDPNQHRMNELIRIDNSLPLSLISAFINPQHDSPYSAIQAIVAVGDFSDQSYLLFDESYRATAKKEYDAEARRSFNINETDKPEWDPVARNAEKRVRKKKQLAEEQQSVQPTPAMQEADHGQGVQNEQVEYDRLLELEMVEALTWDDLTRTNNAV
ncbi:hypothetical protein AUP68_03527 [Ilyonectria robusta]